MNHVWHTRILVSCIAIAAVIDAGEEALSRAPHVVAKLPDLWWLHYAPLSLLSIAAILWIVRLLQNWTSPNIKPQAQTQPLKPAIELAPSKLRIHSASYAPIDGEGDDYPVAEFLSQITNGDSLVLDNIQNQSFQTPSHNFVPKDPKVGTKKRLLVEYSFGNEKTTTIERREESRIVLPEDPFLKVFNLLQLRAFHLAGRLRAF